MSYSPWGHKELDTTKWLLLFCYLPRDTFFPWNFGKEKWAWGKKKNFLKKFSRPESWSGWPFSSPGDLPNPGMEHWSPTFQAGSLPSEPSGKPKNTGVGSLSLFQGIFPIQELTRVSCIASGFFTSWATTQSELLNIKCCICCCWVASVVSDSALLTKNAPIWHKREPLTSPTLLNSGSVREITPKLFHFASPDCKNKVGNWKTKMVVPEMANFQCSFKMYSSTGLLKWFPFMH